MEDNIQAFNVYSYNGNEKLENTFTITIENVPAENYELNIIDGNNFTIKNVKQYNKNPMTIICEDTISKKTESIQIWLGGNW